ncbi:hypothetical protein C5O80_10800 [Burkholderia sp. SRS-46]|nr:hypothetical protein C5O80_10800 [Burkholderia sp. SRS-46]
MASKQILQPKRDRVSGHAGQVQLVPWLKLLGRWLEHAGFDPGQRLKAEVQLGRLVINHA